MKVANRVSFKIHRNTIRVFAGAMGFATQLHLNSITFATPMKVLVSIAMSFMLLLQGVAMDMDLCDKIEKVSTFIEHYQDHKEFDGDSLFEYVVEDYFNNDGDKQGHHDDSSHDEVPSHSQHQCCHPIVFVSTSNSVAIKSIRFEGNIQFDHYTLPFNSRFLESLFQPPRA